MFFKNEWNHHERFGIDPYMYLFLIVYFKNIFYILTGFHYYCNWILYLKIFIVLLFIIIIDSLEKSESPSISLVHSRRTL